jgi:tryptophan halogenase
VGETLGVGYNDWSRELPCDRMLSFATEPDPLPATLMHCTATDYGWMLRVPLQQRSAATMLFASRLFNVETAVDRAVAEYRPQSDAAPIVTRFRNGPRTHFWDRNCIALGAAAGSIEPLVFSELHLVQSAVMRLARMFPDTACDPGIAREYNNETREEFENARDYLTVYYRFDGQRDSAFWQAAGSAPASAALRRKHALFRSSGGVLLLENETFPAAAWVAAWISAGVWPQGYHPLLDRMDAAELTAHFAKMSSAIDAAAAQLPLHDACIGELPGQCSGKHWQATRW